MEQNSGFTGFKYYLGASFTYITFGILFGALNALRMAGRLDLPEIHTTHWTSTLIGGMTLLMMGLIYYIFSKHFDRDINSERIMYAVLVTIILATIANYFRAWVPGSLPGRYFDELVKLASLLYLVGFILLLSKNKEKWNSEMAFIPLYFAILWMGVAQLLFLGSGVIGPTFRIPYIYGFFSLTLFGALYYLLPRMYRSGTKTLGNAWRDSILISLSAGALLLNEFVDVSSLLGFVGSILWGLVGFMFILYIFDLVFKNGLKMGLLGLSLSLVMFGFFVFDTFMKAVFPVWVSSSHAHFMFLGTLLIAILSIVIGLQERDEKELSMPLKVNLGLVLLMVIFVLGGFLVVALSSEEFARSGFTFAGHSGFALFAFLLAFEYQYLRSLSSIQASE